MNKREMAESIMMTLNGGIWNDESPWTFQQVVHHINNAIAEAAKKSAFENSNLSGLTYADDNFISLFKKQVIQTDSDNGQKYIDLPATPVGLPRGAGLIKVSPSSTYKSVNIKPISRIEATMFYGLPTIPNTIFWYIEDKKIKFVGCVLPPSTNWDITMITAGGNNLDEEINAPADFLGEIEQVVTERLRAINPADTIDDGEHYVDNTIN